MLVCRGTRSEDLNIAGGPSNPLQADVPVQMQGAVVPVTGEPASGNVNQPLPHKLSYEV